MGRTSDNAFTVSRKLKKYIEKLQQAISLSYCVSLSVSAVSVNSMSCNTCNLKININLSHCVTEEILLILRKSPTPATHIQDLILTEAESLRLFGGRKSSLEGLACGRGCGGISVTLRQDPVAHQALQKGGQVATHFQHQLLKSLLSCLPDSTIMVLGGKTSHV